MGDGAQGGRNPVRSSAGGPWRWCRGATHAHFRVGGSLVTRPRCPRTQQPRPTLRYRVFRMTEGGSDGCPEKD
jgi:hypothetical protein